MGGFLSFFRFFFSSDEGNGKEYFIKKQVTNFTQVTDTYKEKMSFCFEANQKQMDHFSKGKVGNLVMIHLPEI